MEIYTLETYYVSKKGTAQKCALPVGPVIGEVRSRDTRQSSYSIASRNVACIWQQWGVCTEEGAMKQVREQILAIDFGGMRSGYAVVRRTPCPTPDRDAGKGSKR